MSFNFLLSTAQAEPKQAVTTSILSGQLAEYESLNPQVQRLIDQALNLASLNLAYQYGSASPKKGGMDCSGAIYYLLNLQDGMSGVPRQANEIYRWVWLKSQFHAVTSTRQDSFEWSKLNPGDLLFWSGTYQIEREPPVTHVMLYLGTLKDNGRRVMFGASSGRRYGKEPQHGVSVFTLDLPGKNSASRFLGYGSVPGIHVTPRIKR